MAGITPAILIESLKISIEELTHKDIEKLSSEVNAILIKEIVEILHKTEYVSIQGKKFADGFRRCRCLEWFCLPLIDAPIYLLAMSLYGILQHYDKH
jgi:hypothetical protein